MFRHGCLFVACFCFVIAQVRADITKVRSRVFDLEYRINPSALPLDSVQLWYTTDDGANWHAYGYDEDRQPPITFRAPSEGKFGFQVLAINATGPSSQQPTRGSKPQLWAFVDYTPPVVQLHSAQKATMLGQRVIKLRWSAVDAQLSARPVVVRFQRLPGETWEQATAEPLANTGRFDWRIPANLSGAIGVRIVVTDKGGHRVESGRKVVELGEPAFGGQTSAESHIEQVRGTESSRDRPTKGLGAPGRGDENRPTPVQKSRAATLFREAMAYRDEGNVRRAMARLREVAKLDPHMTKAFSEMGTMLYELGDFRNSLDAFSVAISQQPRLKSSLKGAAMALRQLQDYESSAEKLRAVLGYQPDDAQTWMDLGDIGIYQGDELLARECYIKAGQVDPKATGVMDQARKRLALMAEVSRSHGGRGR